MSSNADIRRDVCHQQNVLQSSTLSAHDEVVMKTETFGKLSAGTTSLHELSGGTEHHRAVALYTLRFAQLRQQSWFKAVMLQEGKT